MARRSEEYERAISLLRRLPDDEIDRFADLIQKKVDNPDPLGGIEITVVDFDNIICDPHEWKGPLNITAGANKSAIAKINTLPKGTVIAIYSHRIKYEGGETAVRNYCIKHGLYVGRPDMFFTSGIPRGSKKFSVLEG